MILPYANEFKQVLQIIRNISILLSTIQVLIVVLLAIILGVLIAILITINPDLEHERQAIVTPAVRRVVSVAKWMKKISLALIVMLGVVVVACSIAGSAGV